MQIDSELYQFNGADEEPVDPKKYLEETCKPKCVRPLLEYQACVKRIQDDESGHKHCTGQYFDYWSCVDKCVSSLSLFKVHLDFGSGHQLNLAFSNAGCTKAVFKTEVVRMC
uniref:Complex III subunit VI n=1 Tax=Salix viminalis TaxID=40686 RepID=A0A6N2LN36_SALVM